MTEVKTIDLGFWAPSWISCYRLKSKEIDLKLSLFESLSTFPEAKEGDLFRSTH